VFLDAASLHCAGCPGGSLVHFQGVRGWHQGLHGVVLWCGVAEGYVLRQSTQHFKLAMYDVSMGFVVV
jgi:hypothetical protein